MKNNKKEILYLSEMSDIFFRLNMCQSWDVDDETQQQKSRLKVNISRVHTRWAGYSTYRIIDKRIFAMKLPTRVHNWRIYVDWWKSISHKCLISYFRSFNSEWTKLSDSKRPHFHDTFLYIKQITDDDDNFRWRILFDFRLLIHRLMSTRFH